MLKSQRIKPRNQRRGIKRTGPSEVLTRGDARTLITRKIVGRSWFPDILFLSDFLT